MKRIVFGILFILPILASAQSGSWAIKVGMLGALNQNLSVGVEYGLSEKVALDFKIGITNPQLVSDDPFSDGFFWKAGAKVYLFDTEEKLSGAFIKPTVVYNRWRNRERELNGQFSNIRETSIGGMVEMGYSIPILKNLRLEPYFGFGVVPTWASYEVVNDTPPFTINKVRWDLLYYDELEQPPVSHLPLKSLYHLAISGGLNIGIVF